MNARRNCGGAKLVLCDLKFGEGGRVRVRKYLMTNPVTGVRVRPELTLWPAGSQAARRQGLGPEGTYEDALDAARKAAVWWDRMRDARARGAGDMLCDMMDAWIDANAPRWAEPTVPKYRANVRLHVRPYLGNVKVADCRPWMFDDLLDRLAEEGSEGGRPLSPNTVRGVYQNISSAFDWGMVMGWAASNPMKFVAKPKPGRYAAAYLKAGDLSALDAELSAVLSGDAGASSMRRCALFGAWLSLRTGLRLGEVCALRLSDVWRDIVTGDVLGVSVSGTVTEAGGLRRLDRPKTASSNRRVPIARGYAERVEEHVAWQSGLPGIAPGADVPLLSVDGGPMRPSYVSACFSDLRDRLGLPREATFHSLRHTYASIHLAVLNTPVVDVARYMGHASPEVTNRVYAHVMRAEGSEDAEAYARAVGRMGGA